MVTVHPNETEPKLHAHDGQELNLMVEGRMRFYFGELTYELSQGDSVYFDSGTPHAMRALDGKPAKFLAAVMKERSN
jgi:quercetin dioxygenase-like cupin family protein